ncbi:capsular exopolysaccharide family [Desulfobulbus propionicus DSM 2032]|uniref:Capsular exopolysaccharide family n=1 Tax=Desulfobulbus propionicus (strain ATCC 33891 / DSM 2032 / VKM B-1956 / 1pr3) TaxID=577650 RepID=A0A7U4DQ89_DESPD|nr:capsular exopolysaccharide family [Desulfobulbus propionicus DSM 2032]
MGKVFNALKRVDASEDTVPSAAEQVALESQNFPEVDSRETGHTHEDEAADRQSPRQGRWDDRLSLATVTTGPVAESIRALRTRILYPNSGPIPRSILVTSASPGEGKSFICANLGISLAQGVDNYCLLVDCDLRRPAQHTLFGLSNRSGLADYLQHKKKLSELLVSSGVEKLSILQAGPRSINPAELLGSASMISLVDELAKRYDDRIVLLDSPPLHAASETAVLAQHVDGVILVVRYGASRREYVKALADAIGRDKILGVVFNAYKATMLDYKVFGYYEYQQDYYYSEQ